MIRYIIALVFMLSTFSFYCDNIVLAAESEASVYINENTSDFASQKTTPIMAIVIDGVTLVPAEKFFETAKLSFFYGSLCQDIYASCDTVEMYCLISEKLFLFSDKRTGGSFVRSAPVFYKESTVFIPLRLVSECFGYNVVWEEFTKSVHLDRLEPSDIEDMLFFDSADNSLEPGKLHLICRMKRAKLENLYGVSIKYSYEVNGYSPKGKKILTYLNEYDSFNMLTRIENVLSQYSYDFFSNIRAHGTRLSFYLVDSFYGGYFMGLTDKQDKDNIIITITNCQDFERVANHEIMHYIEAAMTSIKISCEDELSYMNGIWDSDNSFPLWDDYNPKGFLYGTLNYDYVVCDVSEVYFVNMYSKINEREDRANIFESLMSGDFHYGADISGNILAKAEYLVSEISSRLPFADFIKDKLD